MRRVRLAKFPVDIRQAVINAAVDVDGDVVTLRPADYLRLRVAGWKPGDQVAAATKAMHIPHCRGCERRRKQLNKLPRKLLTSD